MISEERDSSQPPSRARPRLLGPLLAAAHRITNRSRNKNRGASGQSWQDDAWAMYDLVGEQHFLATTLANRIGMARLYVGRTADDPTDEPEPVEDGQPAEVFDAFAGSHGAQSQVIARLALNLFIAGDGWLAGIPRQLIPTSGPGTNGPDDPDDVPPQTLYGPGAEPLLALSDLEWRMLSVSEVSFKSRQVELKLGENTEETIEVSPDDVFLVRVWRPHPKLWWEADSPTRASLPILRELVGLTEHVSAQIDSRLAGAGVFIVPSSARDALLPRTGDPNDTEDDADIFTEALMEAMTKPIQDRSSASAYVPLVVTVPDEAADKFKHISFASQLDAEARNLREEAIRRLALGQDCPPEVLLGMGDANHWSAWLVREDTITTHIEPPLALICDALTTQFLRPVLIQGGMSPEEADEYVVWYDVSDMIMRPNRTADAAQLYGAGVISAEAYRDAAGFSDNDAPPVTDPVIELVLDMVKQSPTLAESPGIAALVDQIRAVIAGDTSPPEEEAEPEPDEPEAETSEPGPVSEPGVPEETDQPPAAGEPAPVAASGQIVVNYANPPAHVYSPEEARRVIGNRLDRLNRGGIVRR